METVNNLASAASRVIWGEGKSEKEPETAKEDVKDNETKENEPVSGQTGNVDVGEPYDKGNANANPPTSTDTQPSTPNPPILTHNPKPDAPGITQVQASIRPEHEASKTGATDVNQPTSGITDQNPTFKNDNSGPGAAPSVSADPSSAPQDTQRQQGADRTSDEPSTEEHNHIKETKEAEEAAIVDTSGPGPKSLKERAREDSAGKEEEGEEDGPQKKSQGDGTGELYVKSSGMEADGGDFDAARPGAGREADRLLDEKGIHHEPGADGPPAGKEDVSGSSESKSGKTKLSEKIKAKLHIGRDKD